VLQAQVDHNRGIVQSRTGFLFTGNDRGYYFSTVDDPNGYIVASKRSICLSPLDVYEKVTGTNANGWVRMAAIVLNHYTFTPTFYRLPEWD
jgi:hypothetical protein